MTKEINAGREPRQHVCRQTVSFQLKKINQQRDEYFKEERPLYWAMQAAQLDELISTTAKEFYAQCDAKNFDVKTLAQLRELYKDRAELLALYRIADDIADQQSDSDRGAKTLKIGFVDATGIR
jgi:hypothetical protein